MLLAIDVGNTNITLGLFEAERLTHSWRLATLRERTGDELGVLITLLFDHEHLDRGRVEAVVLASVVPPLTGMTIEMTRRYFGREPLVVDPASNTGMPVLYDTPADVGADRVVNGVAAYELYGRATRNAVVVVDFGTGTTFDAITAKGEYLGGVIVPGIQISADALFERAARLPKVEVRKPATVIGRTTVGSMQSGLFFGYVEMIDGLVRRMRAELGEPAARCVATGGLAPMIAADTTVIEEVNLDLTLQGLRMIWERNARR